MTFCDLFVTVKSKVDRLGGEKERMWGCGGRGVELSHHGLQPHFGECLCGRNHIVIAGENLSVYVGKTASYIYTPYLAIKKQKIYIRQNTNKSILSGIYGNRRHFLECNIAMLGHNGRHKSDSVYKIPQLLIIEIIS